MFLIEFCTLTTLHLKCTQFLLASQNLKEKKKQKRNNMWYTGINHR